LAALTPTQGLGLFALCKKPIWRRRAWCECARTGRGTSRAVEGSSVPPGHCGMGGVDGAGLLPGEAGLPVGGTCSCICGVGKRGFSFSVLEAPAVAEPVLVPWAADPGRIGARGAGVRGDPFDCWDYPGRRGARQYGRDRTLGSQRRRLRWERACAHSAELHARRSGP
jgi:hypothetical protein